MTGPVRDAAPRVHLRRDRLVRGLALLGVLLLAIAELLALTSRGADVLASGGPPG